MSTLVKPRYTPEQYLEWERKAEYKSEYINGVIYAMSGASREHNLISGNVFGEVRAQLRGRTCEAYIADMRVKIDATGMYAYPDVVALCGEPQFEDAHVDTLTNPTVLIEVLSPSTEAYDRGAKAARYRRLESLQEYVLIAQDRISVEHYARPTQEASEQTRDETTGLADAPRAHWIFTEFTDLTDVVTLRSIGCSLRLSDVYDRVTFADDGGAPSA